MIDERKNKEKKKKERERGRERRREGRRIKEEIHMYPFITVVLFL